MAINVGNLVIVEKPSESQMTQIASGITAGKLVVINKDKPKPEELLPLPAGEPRPIFESLIDRKKNSSYLFDMLQP